MTTERKSLSEMGREIHEAIFEQIFIVREEDSFEDTLNEVTALFLEMFAIYFLKLIRKDRREQFFSDNFPILCHELENRFLGVLDELKNEEK